MANASASNWDNAAPAQGDSISAGDDEIRYLREGLYDRLGKSMVACDDGGAGGEMLEGSARIHTGTARPTNQVVGALVNTTIASSAARAEGLVYLDTDTDLLEVYVDGAWQDLKYLPLSGGTMTGSLTTGTLATANITATGTIAGITATNLVDKSATETITGAWTHTANNTFATVIVTGLSSGSTLSAINVTSDMEFSIGKQIKLRYEDDNAPTGNDADDKAVINIKGGNEDSPCICLENNTTSGGPQIRLLPTTLYAFRTAGGSPYEGSHNGDMFFDGSNLYIFVGGLRYKLDMTEA